jgi:DnaK suppressor protein
MTADQFNGLRSALERKRDELSTLIEKRDLIAIERAADAIDQVQLAAERELAIETIHRETLVLRQVRDSLRRMADGTYGLCRRCDQEIGLKRLQAVPWAVYCVTCQAALDDEQDRARISAGVLSKVPAPLE